MKAVRMYSTHYCPFCVMAKRLLSAKGVQVEEIRVDDAPERRDEMVRITGRRTVPQIFVGETHVGGFDDLHALDRAGRLDPLLND
ncbi:glutaredoxin 3 [Fontimonas sp. SYSU GA230001]|uniref:glutaredoxin 3 n=1 Tax=Fontimonas sp. SYSU GA230001 TaxID=3142450 RepID=UPI0032B5F7F4